MKRAIFDLIKKEMLWAYGRRKNAMMNDNSNECLPRMLSVFISISIQPHVG